MDEDLIVLGAPAETQAAGAEAPIATDQTDGRPAGGEAPAATPGTGQADPAAAEPRSEAPKADGEGDAETEKPKKRSGITRMQDRITRLEAELSEARSAAPAAGDRTAAIEQEIGKPPKEEDFDDYVKFERAQRQYDVRLALAEQRQADREAQASTRQTQVRQEAIDAFHDRQDAARERIKDYDEVLASAKDAKIAPHVSELVVESEKGGLLAYHLAKNPEQLEKLNRMSPLQAAKAIGALEPRLTLAKPKTATSAPAPAKPVSGAAAPSADPSKMSMAEYAAWRAKAG